jgi:pimeloyl-ACP methyl ester carboxylesterase
MDTPEYEIAMMEFYKKHMCWVDPWPEEFTKSFDWMKQDGTVGLTMYVALCSIPTSHQVLLKVEGCFGLREINLEANGNRLGKSEFLVTGSLRDWSAVDVVGEIEAETLVINGVEEGASDESVRSFVERIQNVRWEKMRGASHVPFYENPEKYFEIVGNFLLEN